MQANGTSRKWQSKAVIALFTVFLSVPGVAQSSSLIAKAGSDRTIVVSIPDRRLVVVENEQVIGMFRVAVGAAENPTPTGEFRIINRLINPTYYHPGLVIAAGENNPIGTRWIGISKKGYGIHGTNVPQSVGHAASHGCIRLRNSDIEHLFSMVQVGDRVEVHETRDRDVARWFGSGDQNEIAGTNVSTAPAGGQ